MTGNEWNALGFLIAIGIIAFAFWLFITVCGDGKPRER
jgi:hypothetical protein